MSSTVVSHLTSADIAENGQVVPVAIRSALPRTDLIALLVDKNPNVLAGAYGIAVTLAMLIDSILILVKNTLAN